MHDIGTVIKVFNDHDVRVKYTICGYIYYRTQLYYVCIDEDGNEVDINHWRAVL